MSAFKGKAKNKGILKRTERETKKLNKKFYEMEGSPLGELDRLSGGEGFNKDLDEALKEEINKNNI